MRVYACGAAASSMNVRRVGPMLPWKKLNRSGMCCVVGMVILPMIPTLGRIGRTRRRDVCLNMCEDMVIWICCVFEKGSFEIGDGEFGH